uniref:GH16 domain-containing protein n=1 Tax=Oryza nivara TaxID=4536 RepID=A0A0E0HM63_ORYNI
MPSADAPLRRRVPDEGQLCSYVDTAPQRDELDFEFLGNRTGESYSYIIQTNLDARSHEHPN